MDPSNKEFPEIPQRISALPSLAYNLWWSWHAEARVLFKMLDRTSWKLSVHNPVKMLRTLDGSLLQKAVNDPEFLKLYDKVIAVFQEDMRSKGGWFPKSYPLSQNDSIAFFSAEYGLHHSLPFYAGGLGFLAGDLLKESSDLGIPLVAVGFMYPEGYIKQRMSPDGCQQDDNELLDREAAPITCIKNERGTHKVVKVPFIEPDVYIEFWKAQVGTIELYLMDTDIDENDPWNRGITSHLYIGSPEQRLRQEIVLGIGGAEVLRQMGRQHSVLHLNEGYTAFAILERIREMIATGSTFSDAFNHVRSTTLFTTHTSVPAGNDVFSFPLMEKYFSTYWPTLGLDRNSFLQLGVDPKNPRAGFNMTVFALNASQFHNAVSFRHGEVARKLWRYLWPGTPVEDIPITAITNGIHVPTWIEPKMQLLFNKYLGQDWLLHHDDPALWKRVDAIPDKELWQTHAWLKAKLVMRIMDRARDQLVEERPDPRVILASGVLLNPTVLTVGFARRFASYKRATLLFEDIERLARIVNDRFRPVQIVFAGKAHPADDQGKRLLQQVFNAAKDYTFGGRIAFIEDYDENLAQYLTHGVDVWLNNPKPPYEACGTSGMKAALNGVPHLSILDGWWIEGYNGRNGWAFGDKEGTQSDDQDAASLYELLEKKVVPLFYDANDEGVPQQWVALMKETIKSTAAAFSARRMMKEYVSKCYQPALQAARSRMQNAVIQS